MTVDRSASMVAADIGAGRRTDPSPPRFIRLRRDGLPPLCFTGRMIARHDGRVPGAMLWHDIGLYRAATATYGVEIVAQLLVAAPDPAPLAPNGVHSRPTCCHAALFDTLDGALTALESHDASQDVCPGVSAPSLSLNDPATPPAMLLMQAAVLQGFCRDVVRRYRIGVGVLLADIGLQDV